MKHYNTIRNWLYSNKKTYEWLGNRIGRSESYIWKRLNGEGDWTIRDAYRILDLMGKDGEAFSDVFGRKELVK